MTAAEPNAQLEIERLQRENEALRRQTEHLRTALESRATIEQAKGIIIATAHCSPEEAFEILTEQSNHQNRKLRDVAADLVAQQHRHRRHLGRPSRCS